MNRNTLNFWLELVSALVIAGLAVTGGIIHFVLPPGTGRTSLLFGLGRHDYGEIHFWLAVSALLLVIVHVWLHWNWVCCIVGRSAGNPQPGKTGKTFAGVIFLAVLIFGLIGFLWWASGQVTADGRSYQGGRHQKQGLGNIMKGDHNDFQY